MLSEATLLIVAAEAGFVDGPRVCANMAVDSWMPHGLSSLSERLTVEKGILMMAATSLLALIYTHGDVGAIVVMYSINVFLTFSLSMAGMTWHWLRTRENLRLRARRLALFIPTFLLCATILIVTVYAKFEEGGWITVAVTGLLIGACLLIRAYYRSIAATMKRLYAQFDELPVSEDAAIADLDSKKATAVVMTGAYGALGIHSLLNVIRVFPGHFEQFVFVSIGVLDSGGFKGEDTADALTKATEDTLKNYVKLANGMGTRSSSRMAIGTDFVDEAEKTCLQLAKDFPRIVFFGGKLIFQNERWYHRLLHNNSAFALQKRLHMAGHTMVILPARVE